MYSRRPLKPLPIPKSTPLIHILQNLAADFLFLQFVTDGLSVLITEVEHIFGAAADGGDFRIVQLDIQLGKRQAYGGQQTGAVGGDQFDNGVPV